MGCSETRHKQIVEILTGEINPIRRMIISGHLRRCEECRSEHEDLQVIWNRCTELSTEPAGDNLKTRIAQALPTQQQNVHQVTFKEALMMKKRVLTVIAVLIVAVTGLVASQYMGHGSHGYGWVDGRKWSYTSTFQGQMSFLHPDGSPVRGGGVVATIPGDPREGQVCLTVEGKDYNFSGVGNHEVRDPETGQLLGYVSMKPAPVKSLQESENDFFSGSGGVRGRPYGAQGYDNVLGISWEMHGSGKVTMEAAKGVSAGIIRGSTESSCKTEKVPELTVKVGNKKIVKQGYGRYEIPNSTGKTVMIITIEPGSPAE